MVANERRSTASWGSGQDRTDSVGKIHATDDSNGIEGENYDFVVVL